MKELALASLAALVAALVLWFGFAPRSARGVEAAARPGDPTAAGDELREVAAPAGDARASVPTTTTTTASDGEQLTIEVVDASSGAPVADAVVSIEDERLTSLEREVLCSTWPDADEAIAHGLGTAWRTDERGVVRVPRPASRTTAWASSGRRHSVGHEISDGATRLRLELAASVCIDVEVFDRAARPVPDVDVVLIVDDAGGWLHSTRTGADGRACFHQLDFGVEEPAALVAIATPLVDSDPPGVAFELRGAPTAPVRLVIGETGAVELATVDAEGRPIACGAGFYLGRFRDDEPTGELLVDARRTLATRTTSDGRARFERVGLGGALYASAGSGWDTFLRADLAGPANAAETAHAELVLEHAVTKIVGRIVTPGGAPLGGRDLSLRDGPEHDEALSGAAYRSSSAADGRFVFAFDSRRGEEAPRDPWLFATHLGGPPDSGHAPLPASRAVRDPVPRDEFDLGDVVCVPMPLLCSGRVVDASGAPCSSLQVWIRPEQRGRDATWWTRATTTDLRGEFELHGAAPARFALAAGDERAATRELVHATAGATGLVVVVDRVALAEVDACVVAPPDVPFAELELALERAPDPCAAPEHVAIFERASGPSFKLHCVDAGRATLVVRHGGRLLATSPIVELVPARYNSIPTLRPGT